MERNGRFLDQITEFIFVEHKLEVADIIFVPGNTFGEIAEEAARVYREGYSRLVLPSGRFSILKEAFEGEYETEWDFIADILTANGVARSDILEEKQASYTYENAIYSRKVTDEKGLCIKKAIICCQAFHARRCLMYYQLLFPETEFLIRPVETRGIRRDNWYLDPQKIDTVLDELARCGNQFHDILKELI